VSKLMSFDLGDTIEFEWRPQRPVTVDRRMLEAVRGLRSVAIDRASRRQKITYGEAAVAIAGLYIPQGFGRALDLLSWDCEQRGEPSLACLFVRQGDGEVGSGFGGTVEEAEACCTECFNHWAR
jgi:hypothetical protein